MAQGPAHRGGRREIRDVFYIVALTVMRGRMRLKADSHRVGRQLRHRLKTQFS